MKYIGLDLGTRTLGIASSDITGLIATSHSTIRFPDEDYDKALNDLEEILQAENPSKIILGFPKNMNNTIGPRGEETLKFKEMLEKRFNKEVIMQDERLTTKEANSYMLEADMSRKKRKKKIDALAATVILQSYLDKENSKERNEKDGE